MSREIAALLPRYDRAFVSREMTYTAEGAVADTIVVCLLQNDRKLTAEKRGRIEKWLRPAQGIPKVKLYLENGL